MGKVENIIKSEITRLATREVRRAFLPLRREVRAMKGKLSGLAKVVTSLDRLAKEKFRKAEGQEVQVDAYLEEAKKSRFTPARIRHLREKLGLSQKGLATLAGVTLGAVGLWEKGKFAPKLDKKATLMALRKMGKREVKNLLKGKKGPEPKVRGEKTPKKIMRRKGRRAKK
jgi:DNA-binding transcriptional regulator YiaG